MGLDRGLRGDPQTAAVTLSEVVFNTNRRGDLLGTRNLAVVVAELVVPKLDCEVEGGLL